MTGDASDKSGRLLILPHHHPSIVSERCTVMPALEIVHRP
jgi:hypothetical protein